MSFSEAQLVDGPHLTALKTGNGGQGSPGRTRSTMACAMPFGTARSGLKDLRPNPPRLLTSTTLS